MPANRIRPTPGACLLALLLVAPIGRALAGTTPVGVVAEYRPAFAHYVLRRGSAAVAARIGTTVMAGDKVTLPQDGVLVVQLADQTSRRYSGPGTYDIPAVPGGNRLMAVLASIPALFEEQHRRYGTAATRGSAQCGAPDAQPEPLAVPIVDAGARIAAGQHDLQLAWRGGCKPFRVFVLAADGRAVATRDALDERRVRLTAVDLPAGRYALIVTDAGGLRYEAPLEAVAAAPTPPDEIASGTGAVGDVGRGVWLASQPDANWRLAAYEALRPSIEMGDALAVALGESLLTGRAPPL
jgi:hypothetical protein